MIWGEKYHRCYGREGVLTMEREVGRKSKTESSTQWIAQEKKKKKPKTSPKPLMGKTRGADYSEFFTISRAQRLVLDIFAVLGGAWRA